MENGRVDSRHVDGTGWLEVFWGKTERVDIDTDSWASGVVLVRLDQVKVSGLSDSESVLSIELEFGINHVINSRGVGSTKVDFVLGSDQ